MYSPRKPLVIDSLTKSYNKIPVLDKFSLTISNGEIIGIAGTNGSGKSTLLKLIAGIINPDEGCGTVCGKNIFNRSYQYREHIQYWGQVPSLYPSLTGLENLKLSLELSKISCTEKDLHKYIKQSDLSNKIYDSVITYSLGMIQKLNLLRFIISNWELGLMDEPNSSLDDNGIEQLIKNINNWSKKNRALIVSSHDISFLKMITSKIIYLDKKQ